MPCTVPVTQCGKGGGGVRHGEGARGGGGGSVRSVSHESNFFQQGGGGSNFWIIISAKVVIRFSFKFSHVAGDLELLPAKFQKAYKLYTRCMSKIERDFVEMSPRCMSKIERDWMTFLTPPPPPPPGKR